MNVGEILYTLLHGDATVEGLVGTRIFPLWAQQDAEFPQLVYNVEGVKPQECKGVAVSDVDMVMVAIDVWGKHWDHVQTLFDAVRAKLDRYSGTVAGKNVNMITFVEANTSRDDLAAIARATMFFRMRLIR